MAGARINIDSHRGDLRLQRFPQMGAEHAVISPPNLKMSGTQFYSMNSYKSRVMARQPFALERMSADPDTGLQIMGRGVKELVQSVQRLRHLGIEDLGLPLPKIVVVGDQSTGKSSLIEGLSEIKVPRDTGTCTRCPLEINLTERTDGGAWKCGVSLFRTYMYQGKRSTLSSTFQNHGTDGAAQSRSLGPWVKQDAENFPFATLNSKDQVAPVLKLAQLAILNPMDPYEKYLPDKIDPGREIQVEFSPNIVRLDICGPGLPNMSFYDLPGVISVHEVAEEQYLVDLVKSLVMVYITDASCINLLTLPMTDDPANSTAADLIRRAGAEARTVGILTKPDRMEHGESLELWRNILGDRRFRLGLGYHAVKNNPNPKVDHAKARAEEREFFKNPPWSTDLAAYGNRYGTFQLQTFLSDKLTALIKASLPCIKEQVEQKAVTIDKELELFPEPPTGNLPMLILASILDFESQVNRHIEGGSPKYPFQKSWHNIALSFRGALIESRPGLTMSSSVSDQGGLSGSPDLARQKQPVTISIDSDTDDPFVEAECSPRKKQRNFLEINKAAERLHVAEARMTPQHHRVPNAPPNTPNTAEKEEARSQHYSTRFTLTQLRDLIQAGNINLSQHLDPRVIERVAKLSLQYWDKPLNQLLHLTDDLCHTMLLEQIGRSFVYWRPTRIHAEIVEICDSFLKEAISAQRQASTRALELELNFPMAFDEGAMVQAMEDARKEVVTERREHRAGIYVQKYILNTRNGKGNCVFSREERISKVTDEQLGPDPFHKEILLMGTVRAYYAYAVSRFVDVICQGIKGELFVKIRNGIGPMIKERTGIMNPDADERCAPLCEVNAAYKERRRQLKKERAVIKEAQDWLEGLTRGSTEELFL